MAGNADNLLLKVGDPGSATTLNANYTAGDSTLTVVSTSNWTATGEGVIFAIDTVTVVDGEEVQDAGSYNEFEGTVASATSITNVDWVRGAGDTNYSAGSTTRVYIPVSAERENRIVDWGSAEHSVVDGTHTDVTADSVTTTDLTVTGDLTISGVASDGWTSTGGTHSVATGYNAGNRSFTIDTSTDLSSIVSPGMRYRVTRNTTPPTQCADLEASSSHYASAASPSGITFTDDFTCEAWIKLESYGGQGTIINRRTSTQGWIFRVKTDGTLQLLGLNTTSDDVTTYQSIPLGRWVHVAAHIDMSGATGKTYIDGIEVPSLYTNGAATAIVQAGNLGLGARIDSLGDYFDGKLADVRVWSDIRTADEIQDNMYAYPSDTTGLVAHFKLNGDFTDASSNGNDLTAQNSAVATNADNPWNATEYGIITAVSASDIQVFCPEGYGIPNETLTAPYYSTQSAPYGFPRDRGKWRLESLYASHNTQSSPSANTWYNFGRIAIPQGDWHRGYNTTVDHSASTDTTRAVYTTLGETTAAASENSTITKLTAATNVREVFASHNAEVPYTATAITTNYYNVRTGTQAATTLYGVYATTEYISVLYAECAYI